jgi:hypothetical protein
MGPAADPFRVGPYLTGLASGTSLARPCCLGGDLKTNTVKTHMQHLYAKLGLRRVNSGREAQYW